MIEHSDIKGIEQADKETKAKYIPGMIEELEDFISLLRDEEKKEFIINQERQNREGFKSILAELGDKQHSYLSMFGIGLQNIQAKIKTYRGFLDKLNKAK